MLFIEQPFPARRCPTQMDWWRSALKTVRPQVWRIMKVNAENSPEEQEVTLGFRTDSGEPLTVIDTDKDWSIVSFREVQGRLSLVLHSGIEDDRFNLDDFGQIEIVKE